MNEDRYPLTLIRRGKRLDADPGGEDYIWWQELPEGEDPVTLRSVGYEVVDVVPAAEIKRQVETAYLNEGLSFDSLRRIGNLVGANVELLPDD